MRAAARRRVVASVIATLAIAGLGLTVAHADEVTSLTTVDGQLLVAHGDDFTGHTLTMGAELHTKHGIVHLRIPASLHHRYMDLAGKHVHVRGTGTAAAFSAGAVSLDSGQSTAAATAPRAMRIAVVMFHLAGSTAEPVPVATAQDNFFGASGSVADWYNRASNGQVAVTGRVFGYYDNSYAIGSNCNGNETTTFSTLLTKAAQAAAKDGYVASDYDHLVVYTPSVPCSFAGIAWVGSSGAWLNGDSYNHIVTSVAEHELGHNLGLWHAGSYTQCGGVSLSSSCTLGDYGDGWDVMGTTNHYFNAEHKRHLGWMNAASVQTVSSGSATITLSPTEAAPSPNITQEILVPRGDGTSYSVELRYSASAPTYQSGDYDSGLHGVWVHLVSRVSTDDTVLLDMTPSTATLNDGNLAAGSTYTDTAHQISIKTISDGATATVQVCVGGCTGNPPTTTSTTVGSTTTTSTTLPPTTTTSTTVPANPNAVNVYVKGGIVWVIGTAGDDVVHMAWAGNGVRTVDANGAPITAGRYCTVTGTVATCRGNSFHAVLGDGNDWAGVSGKVRSTLEGGNGNDTFVGGDSADRFYGGPGFDTVDYRGRAPGTVTALIGGGPHSGRRGEQDLIAADIEQVLLP
jgi:hypothetical protein